MDETYPWRVDVADAGGRPRPVQIRTEDGHVQVATPPGAGFSVTPEKAYMLAACLQAAADRATMHGQASER